AATGLFGRLALGAHVAERFDELGRFLTGRPQQLQRFLVGAFALLAAAVLGVRQLLLHPPALRFQLPRALFAQQRGVACPTLGFLHLGDGVLEREAVGPQVGA